MIIDDTAGINTRLITRFGVHLPSEDERSDLFSLSFTTALVTGKMRFLLGFVGERALRKVVQLNVVFRLVDIYIYYIDNI